LDIVQYNKDKILKVGYGMEKNKATLQTGLARE